MLWIDLELGCNISDDRLRAAWAASFGIDPHAVSVIEDVADTDPWADPRIRIVLERRRQAGDFPLHVMVILGDNMLDAMVADWEQELVMVRRLCAGLDCHALISDDDPNPYRWLLVTPTGDVTAVRVDPAQLDEADALVLARAAATARTND